MPRPDNRQPDQLRPIEILPDIAPHANGSVLISFGKTRVICCATIEENVPPWMKRQNVPGGWLTAEYSMLPYSTLDRKPRDSTRGGPDGRGIEIQRLIGRSLRAVVDLVKLGQRTLWVDCDVLQADGGTRTASITGAYIATAMACERLLEAKMLKENPLKQKVAAISVGIVNGEAMLDLCYEEDRDAEVDCNVVMTGNEQFVEIQSSGEEATFSPEQLAKMLALSGGGIRQLLQKQEEALQAVRPTATMAKLADLAQHFGRR